MRGGLSRIRCSSANWCEEPLNQSQQLGVVFIDVLDDRLCRITSFALAESALLLRVLCASRTGGSTPPCGAACATGDGALPDRTDLLPREPSGQEPLLPRELSSEAPSIRAAQDKAHPRAGAVAERGERIRGHAQRWPRPHHRTAGRIDLAKLEVLTQPGRCVIDDTGVTDDTPAARGSGLPPSHKEPVNEQRGCLVRTRQNAH